MTVKIKEIVIKYEDDGEESPLTAKELEEKYRPLNLRVHHHCSPPTKNKKGKTEFVEEEPMEFEIDLNKINS